ncbi:kinase-like protein [Dendrothele bispora CBS 962.96]|uniref:Kinase-like protein n=1 Tax=Dendrothele bispora (strain CBS 962.96) TaxID=1314807 RepID=A0A4S8LSM8_DENBC|nr:kinase-like protein [Dendrothele bispora CBS 962.96]
MPSTGGYDRLNQSALRVLTKALEVDPSADLEDTLRRLYTSYSTLRNSTDSPRIAESLLRVLSLYEPIAVNGTRMIVPLSNNSDVLVKVGENIGPEEHELLSLIADNVPSILVPRPLGYLIIGSWSFMFMTRLPGQCLEERWSTLDMSQKERVRVHLDNIFRELRNIEFPNGWAVGSIQEPRQCKDCRRELRISPGPIYNESQFNDFLTHSPTSRSRAAEGYRNWICSMLRTDHRFVLTHGDFHPRNIMVELGSDGNMSLGLVDWEMGGFYPEYWEIQHQQMTRACTKDNNDWWDYLPQCILGYDHEIVVDYLVERVLLC